MTFNNCETNIIFLGDFNARTGVSEDFVELDYEHNETPSRGNREKITNTNGRFLLDLCNTTVMSFVNGRIGSDKGIGEITCITHNGKRLIDYSIIDSSSLNLIKDITIWNFDECLSDVHCLVLIELSELTETPPGDSVVVPKLKRNCSREVQELYPSEINLKELIEIENSLQEEQEDPCSLKTLYVANVKIVQVIKDSATKVVQPRYAA